MSFGLQQDLNISKDSEQKLSESNDLLRQRKKVLEDEHAEKYRRLHHNACALNASNDNAAAIVERLADVNRHAKTQRGNVIDSITDRLTGMSRVLRDPTNRKAD